MGNDAGSDVRAVLFDVFGTLVDWRGSLIAKLARFGGERGIAADWAGLVDSWRGGYQPAMDRVRRGALPWTVLDELNRAILDRLVAEHGIAGLREDDLRHLNHGWRRLHPWPDVVEGLRRLKGRFVIGPLSNANLALTVALAKFAGLPWDVTFGSDLFGHYKPDPEVYLGACRLLCLRPEQVMLVAAHNDDLRAARGLGLRTGFVARPAEHGPGQRSDLAPGEAWDVVAPELGVLAERMGA